MCRLPHQAGSPVGRRERNRGLCYNDGSNSTIDAERKHRHYPPEGEQEAATVRQDDSADEEDHPPRGEQAVMDTSIMDSLMGELTYKEGATGRLKAATGGPHDGSKGAPRRGRGMVRTTPHGRKDADHPQAD